MMAMTMAALVLAVGSLVASVCLVLVARHEARGMHAAFSYVLRLMVEMERNAARMRVQVEHTRVDVASALKELQGQGEVLRAVRDETCGPVTVRSGKVAAVSGGGAGVEGEGTTAAVVLRSPGG